MHSHGDILSAVKPLFNFSSCFCLSFFSLKHGRVVVSKTKLYSSIFIFILCLILKSLRMFSNGYPDYELFVINLTTCMFMGFCSISFFNYLTRRTSIVRLWNEIIPLACYIKDDAFYRKTLGVVWFQLIAFNAAYVPFLTFYYFFFSTGSQITFYLAAFADYCMLMHFCMIGAFFSGGLYYGAKLISVANEELAKLKRIEYYKDFKVWDDLEFVKVQKVKNLKCQLRMIKHEDLSPLVDIYDKLCGCFESLNECFGVSVTVSCLEKLMETTLSSYFMIKHGWGAVKVFLFWVLYCLVSGWALLHACESFVKETEKSRHLVGLIVTESSSQTLSEAVQRFSRHLLHRKMKFTACRLFDLDHQVLYSVLTNLITYLVVVVQFDKSRVEQSQ